MKITKEELLEDVTIGYQKRRKGKRYYSHAEIKIDGYAISIDFNYFATIDEAVDSIKERIVEAINKFDLTHETSKLNK